ncbi:flagellar hook-length control protein FliK [Geobacter grbiciae]|uniref:flagellar hook-length control protein FliK n=1 Tax=Geobacter grbiciae TaxID=155042 RepID=UPI001C00E701|nr:flagellar hook-length control protein FliK [Geobacter grbiciae]MBT1074845.1 flagellar hook-length control protein FliK [Geobacter grbiciae]
MSMEIMQMLQVIPQAVPTAGTTPEVPAGSAATPDLFASLMAGLLVQPPATTATAELSALTAETPEPNDQNAAAPETDDITTAEAAMMSLASLVAPQTIVPQAAPVPEITVPTGTTTEVSAATAATQVTATAPSPAAAPVRVMAPESTPAMLPPQADAVIPQPELPRETTKATIPTTEAAPAAPAPTATAQPAPEKNRVEVLAVNLEPAKTTEMAQVEPQVSEPLPETAPAPEIAAADKPAPRTMGPAAAYPDRIPVIPKEAESSSPADKASGTETAPLTDAKLQKVEVTIRDESGKEQSTGEQGKGGSNSADLKAHVAPVQTDAAKPFEPALAGTTKPEHQPNHGLRDSIMAQVKEGIATRQPAGNGEIAIRLAPAELGELRINVQVVDQHVKVEVLAANSQVREILLSNLDSLKENFSRQNLTMTGFDVSTGTGQGYEQLFHQGKEAGQQGGFRTAYQRGTAETEAPATQAADYYYTDRRDSILDVRL